MASEALELVKPLYPPDGLDWAAVMADQASERRYMRKVEPLLHEDFEMFPAQSPGEPRTTVVGVEAYAAALREVMGAFSRFRIVPERFVDLGERIVVMAALEGVTIGTAKRGWAARESSGQLLSDWVPLDVPNRAELRSPGP